MDPVFAYLGSSSARIPYYTWPVVKTAATLVFLHGLKSHAGWFLETGEDLSRRSIKAYAFDRRGSGKSETPRGDVQSYRNWLEDIDAMVKLAKQENPGTPVHLLGHCFGAKLALGFSLQFPNSIASLALIAPPQLSNKADIGLGDKLKVLLHLLTGKSFAIKVPVDDHMFTRNPKKLSFIQNDALRLQTISAHFCGEVLKLDRFINRRLQSIKIPTLVLLAREDPVVDNQKVRSRFFPRLGSPDKRLVEFDCYHHLFFEPLREKVMDQIEEWYLRSWQP